MGLYTDVDLHAFVDDQVGPDRRESIAAYLKTSPADAARVELWRRQNEAIRTVFSGSGSDPVPLWLTVGQIASGQDKPIALPKRAARKPFRSGSAQVRRGISSPNSLRWPVLIAVLSFASGLSIPYAAAHIPRLDALAHLSTLGDVARETFSRRAREAHEAFSSDPDPVDVLDQPKGNLRVWLDRRVSFPVRVPNLAPLGWILLGGRVVPGEVGPGALLVYGRDGGDRLSLYTGRTSQAFSNKDVAVIDASNVLAWSDGMIGSALVATLPGAWMQRNADALQSAVRGQDPD